MRKDPKQCTDLNTKADLAYFRKELADLREAFQLLLKVFRARIVTSQKNERILELDLGGTRRSIILRNSDGKNIQFPD